MVYESIQILFVVGATCAMTYFASCSIHSKSIRTRVPNIIGGFVFPHGGITVNPQTKNFSKTPAVLPTSKGECIKLHQAMKDTAANLVNSGPDLIFLSTPHGLRLKNNYLFLGNSKAAGKFSNYTAKFTIDVENSKLLVKNLKAKGNPVELLRLGAESDSLPLRWGEVIPWWFIETAADNVKAILPPVIFIGQPTKRAEGAKEMIPELLKLGGDIFQWIASDENISQKKIAFVVSSDLSHYHSSHPTSPYPYSEFATIFDGFVSEWADTDRIPEKEAESYDKLILKAGELVDRIGSCGYTGLVTLHGFLSEAVNRGLQFYSRRTYYSAPTYFGMMMNSFILK